MATDYGFQSPAQSCTEGVCKQPLARTMPNPQDRQAAYYLKELQFRLRQVIANPTPAKRAILEAMLDEYTGHVTAGKLRPPRLSFD